MHARKSLIHTKEEKTMGPQGQRTEWCNHKPMSRNDGSHRELEARRGREQILLQSLEGAGPHQHLDFGPVMLISASWPKIKKEYIAVESTHFLILYYDSHRELIHSLQACRRVAHSGFLGQALGLILADLDQKTPLEGSEFSYVMFIGSRGAGRGSSEKGD